MTLRCSCILGRSSNCCRGGRSRPPQRNVDEDRDGRTHELEVVPVGRRHHEARVGPKTRASREHSESRQQLSWLLLLKHNRERIVREDIKLFIHELQVEPAVPELRSRLRVGRAPRDLAYESFHDVIFNHVLIVARCEERRDRREEAVRVWNRDAMRSPTNESSRRQLIRRCRIGNILVPLHA